jgi:ATP-dependent exoDNAse (exonuclease V) beta subunit
MLSSSLSQRNKHERDDRISFDEKTHTYYVDGSSDGIISVTTLIHSHFPKFDSDRVLKIMKNKKEKYPNMSDAQIKKIWYDNGKNASENGTKLHKMIENYYNSIENDKNDEKMTDFQHFLRFNESIKYNFIPYRTEWSVFDGTLDLAGQIDMLYKKIDGTYSLYDWKRIKDLKKDNSFEKGLGKLCLLDHCNYMHYSIQLNIYKRILETRYDIKVSEMCLVVLHPDNDNYVLEKVNDMCRCIDIIFEERKREIDGEI